jgi:hypothetical protein
VLGFSSKVISSVPRVAGEEKEGEVEEDGNASRKAQIKVATDSG